MIRIYYNKGEREAAEKVLSSLSLLSHIQSSEIGYHLSLDSPPNEKELTLILTRYLKAIEENQLKGILITLNNHLSLSKISSITGVTVTGDVKSLCVQAGLWTSLGAFHHSESLVEIFKLENTAQHKLIIRESYIEKLSNFVADESLTTCYLYGLSGLGKTQLAKEFATHEDPFYHCFDNSSQDSSTWWVSFINYTTKPNETITAEHILFLIRQKYGQIKTRKLLIFDDFQWANSYSKRIITALASEIPPPHKIIILSRESPQQDKHLPNTAYIEVKSFTDAEVKQVIENHCPNAGIREIDRKKQLVAKLSKGHPLLTLELTKYIGLHSNTEEIDLENSIVKTIQQLISNNELIDISATSDEFRLLRIIAEINEIIDGGFNMLSNNC